MPPSAVPELLVFFCSILMLSEKDLKETKVIHNFQFIQSISFDILCLELVVFPIYSITLKLINIILPPTTIFLFLCFLFFFLLKVRARLIAFLFFMTNLIH
jgi:hypothetical protein